MQPALDIKLCRRDRARLVAAIALIWKVKKLPEPDIVAAAAIVGSLLFPGGIS
jgi:hypothetical protein